MKQIAVVRIGEEEFGIDIEKVVEILRAQKVCHLPQLPAFFSGIVNIRGAMIPLVDLRARFGVSIVPSKKERVVVIRLGHEKVGLLVDGVVEIIHLQPGEETEPPSMVKGLKAEYLTGLARRGERIIILLSAETLLTSEERIQMGELAKTAGVPHG